jgi:thiol-disulfide isomerase/thioredoxin
MEPLRASITYILGMMRVPHPVKSCVASIVLVFVFSHAFAAKLPNLSAKDLSGGKQRLSSLRGKIVVLSFWATWCGPCQEELPRISQLARKYAGRDVDFVAVSIDEPKDRAKIQPFLDKHEIALKVWVGPDADVLQKFGLGEIVPGTVVIDAQGEPVGRIMGEARDEDVQSRVEWLLGGRQGAAPEALVKRY